MVSINRVDIPEGNTCTAYLQGVIPESAKFLRIFAVILRVIRSDNLVLISSLIRYTTWITNSELWLLGNNLPHHHQILSGYHTWVYSSSNFQENIHGYIILYFGACSLLIGKHAPYIAVLTPLPCLSASLRYRA